MKFCPNCGAPVGKDAKFCSQCGSPIVIDDGVKRSEHTYRKVDEARIREAEATQIIKVNIVAFVVLVAILFIVA